MADTAPKSISPREARMRFLATLRNMSADIELQESVDRVAQMHVIRLVGGTRDGEIHLVETLPSTFVIDGEAYESTGTAHSVGSSPLNHSYRVLGS